MSIRVLVADDQSMVRAGFRMLLTGEQDIEVVAEASNGREAVAMAERFNPAVVLMDIRMPEIDGLELQRRLRARKVAVPVIVITGHGDVALAVEAMKAGAADFIEKPFDDEVLLEAIRSALARRSQDSGNEARLAEIRSHMELLSAREREVLDRLVVGKANKVIAHELGISPRTVEVYRAKVMTKMQADSLSDLVRMVLLCDGTA
jgi:two-component system response regulator FixJ